MLFLFVFDLLCSALLSSADKELYASVNQDEGLLREIMDCTIPATTNQTAQQQQQQQQQQQGSTIYQRQGSANGHSAAAAASAANAYQAQAAASASITDSPALFPMTPINLGHMINERSIADVTLPSPLK